MRIHLAHLSRANFLFTALLRVHKTVAAVELLPAAIISPGENLMSQNAFDCFWACIIYMLCPYCHCAWSCINQVIYNSLESETSDHFCLSASKKTSQLIQSILSQSV